MDYRRPLFSKTSNKGSSAITLEMTDRFFDKLPKLLDENYILEKNHRYKVIELNNYHSKKYHST